MGRGLILGPHRDGFRVLAWSDEPRLDSRNRKPLLRYFPELEPALNALPSGTVLDGEVVVVREDATDFEALQRRSPARGEPSASSLAPLSSPAIAAEMVFFGRVQLVE